MQCHYEILGISKEANDDEIKKAYRKLALQFHPDKNPDKTEECTKRFHVIQQAYEVLIDPQERAWYDKHRDAILRGGLGKGDDYEDNSLDLYQYFNASCFSGYGDDDGGFFSVYGQVFKTISAEDSEYLDLKNSAELAPEFGNSQSSYEEVVGLFYAFWEGYCTAKSYVWVEKYDTREGPNRQVRRIMEQENKKLRDKAKKERNEEVRMLVSFVRKRDKRVHAYKKKLEERAAEIAQLAQQRKQRDREQRLKVMESYKESQWSSMSALERELQLLEANVAKEFGEEHSVEEEEEEHSTGEESGKEELVEDGRGEVEEEAEEEELIDDLLYCAACNKGFKSEKALENHKRSKKHNENVALLRQEMMQDEEQMTEEGEIDGTTVEEIVDEVETTGEPVAKSRSKKQKKKRKQQLQKVQQSTAEDEVEENDVPDGDAVLVGSIRIVEVSEVFANHEVKRSDVTNEDVTENITTETTDSKEEETLTKINKKLKKKETKQKAESSRDEVTTKCVKCNKNFPSRNKLFEHISQTGHALRLVDVATPAAAAAANDNISSRKTKTKQKRKA